MQHVPALIDCSVTGIVISPKLVQRLGLGHQVPYNAALGQYGHILEHANNSQDMTISMH
jgi:hypothetical protein